MDFFVLQGADHWVNISMFKRPLNLLFKIKQKPSYISTQDFSNERHVEWPFCAAHMPTGPGLTLDFGCGSGSSLGFLAALRGFQVIAIDLEQASWPYTHPNLRFVQGDLFELDFPRQHFNLIVNCSSIEHVGIKGRYGVTVSRQDGDLEAMALLRELMKADGVMLLTIPVGQDTVLVPMHRVYGVRRLPCLLQGFTIEHQEYWVKNKANCWQLCEKERALFFLASGNSDDPFSFKNALGCFVLRRPGAI